MWKETCTEILSHKQIICRENRRRIVFVNNRQIQVFKIQVDGCQITEGRKCDCLVMAETTQHFVELKGKKIEEAIPQLSRCIELLGLENFRKMAYIVTSRSPLRSTGIQKMKRNFKKATGADLKIKNGFIIQNI